MNRREFIYIASGVVTANGINRIPSSLFPGLRVTRDSCRSGGITFASFLQEMHNAAQLARWPEEKWHSREVSALKTDKRHNPGYFAQKAIGNFVRIEERKGRREWVLMEHQGPGVIVRMWAPNMAKDAVLRIYFDGNSEPSIEADMMEFFYGRAWVAPPFAELTARGGNVYLPLSFAKSCKITVDKNFCGWAEPPDLFYIIQYRAYAPDSKLRTFDLNQYENSAELLDRAAEDLDTPMIGHFKPEILLNKALAAGTADEVALRSGATALNYLSLHVDASNLEAALRSVVLKIMFDDRATVNCPVGDFFGSGAGLNPFSDWMRTVHENGTMECRWIMPYQKTARLRLENNAALPATLRLSINYQPWSWDEQSMYFHCNFGSKKNISDLPVSNFNFISIQGKGIYVGDTLTIINHSPKWWGEGPAKISIDGESFPSMWSTGTEDYYGYAWGDPTIFQSPFHSQPRVPSGPGFTGTTVNTRIRALDAIRFETSLNINMEVLTQGNMAKEFSRLDYSVATYWYGCEDASGSWKEDVS